VFKRAWEFMVNSVICHYCSQRYLQSVTQKCTNLEQILHGDNP